MAKNLFSLFIPQYLLKAEHHDGVNTRNELIDNQLLLPGVHNEGKVQQGEDTDPAENIDIYYLSTVVLLSLERQYFNFWISF